MKSKTDRILDNVINIVETMTAGNLGFTQAADDAGPVAGFDPLLGSRKKRNGSIDFRRIPNSYKRWVKDIENKGT
jgi:hypothetical protein